MKAPGSRIGCVVACAAAALSCADSPTRPSRALEPGGPPIEHVVRLLGEPVVREVATGLEDPVAAGPLHDSLEDLRAAAALGRADRVPAALTRAERARADYLAVRVSPDDALRLAVLHLVLSRIRDEGLPEHP